MATIRTFEDLDVWKVSRELCLKMGELIDSGGFKNNFRLVGQIEGSSGSIMDNIAEGFERGTRLEFVQYLGYAKGSCGELRSQLHRSFDRKYLSPERYEDLVNMVVRISAMLQKFIRYLFKIICAGRTKKVTDHMNFEVAEVALNELNFKRIKRLWKG